MPRSRSPEARLQRQKPVVWARARFRTIRVNRKRTFVLEAFILLSTGDPGGPPANAASAEVDGATVSRSIPALTLDATVRDRQLEGTNPFGTPIQERSYTDTRDCQSHAFPSALRLESSWLHGQVSQRTILSRYVTVPPKHVPNCVTELRPRSRQGGPVTPFSGMAYVSGACVDPLTL